MKKILITNDDGVEAGGIKALIEAASEFGDIYVVAPEKPQSGMSHAITVNGSIHVKKIVMNETKIAYKCTGTPVDCVKLALNELMDVKPDLCLSGINHGSNSSISVLYSGTMSAAIEASIEGIPSVGFSFLDWSKEADFTAAKKVVKKLIKLLLKTPLKPQTLLNVNIPAVEIDKIKGFKICRQAKGKWVEEFEKKMDHQNNPYYILSGYFKDQDGKEDTDEWALKNNYVSVVPVQIDMTCYKTLQNSKFINFDK